MNLIGWEGIDLVVISTALAKLPILFVGSHGAAKTDGARVIAESILPGCRYAVYECPSIQTDDIIGLPRPKSLDEDMLTFTGSPVSAWNIDSVNLDELLRANPNTVSKLLELVRTRKIYGLKTPIQYVFATANPPSKEYRATPLDIAAASRFVIVKVPGFPELSSADVRRVMTTELKSIPWEVPFSPQAVDFEEATFRVCEIRNKCTENRVFLSGRTCKNLRDVLAWSRVAEAMGCSRQVSDMVTLTISCIPEMSGIATVEAPNYAELETAIISYWEAKLADAFPSTDNWPAYYAHIMMAMDGCASAESASALAAQLPVLLEQKNRESDVMPILQRLVPLVMRHRESSNHDTDIVDAKTYIQRLL